ncbi:nucleotidyltransferase family protein [Catenovulum agarivorans]|uniref:nucleotidyltransferase family protein n=1 Tax=Catenovulum agarivorans TaxID=1172192 RepID=UPI0003052EA5|nr:nucleotidyltransferase family protein [Catenovulum agarivorans]
MSSKIILDHELFISEKQTLLFALKLMDKLGRKLLIVVDQNAKYLTLLSIGDVQRAIISDVDLNSSIESTVLESKLVASHVDSIQKIKKMMVKIRCEFMPVIDSEANVVKIYFWTDLFGKLQLPVTNSRVDAPVVLMAGGQGTRLKPISNVLPKPLIPVGDKTIIESIMSQFSDIGCKHFYVSVNYKKDLIEHFLNQLVTPSINIRYVYEEKPLGTAGALAFLKDEINQTFFLSNCDILLQQDLSQLYDFHKSNNNEITLVSALKHHRLSYGTITTKEDGLLDSLNEKPELTFKINAGVYVLEPHLLKEIPNNTFYHITDLINTVKERGGRVGVFPVSEKSWFDIGEWPEYIKTVRHFNGDENFLGLELPHD